MQLISKSYAANLPLQIGVGGVVGIGGGVGTGGTRGVGGVGGHECPQLQSYRKLISRGIDQPGLEQYFK